MKLLSHPLIAVLGMLLLFVSCEKNELDTPSNYKVSIATAGGEVTLADGNDSILLSATIDAAAEQILEYYWIKLEGPGMPLIANPDSLTTWVSGFEDGTYIFKLTVKSNTGDIGSDTVTIDVIKEQFVTFKPANNTGEVHLFGSSTIDQTHPEAPELLAGSGTFNGEPVDIRALLQFDLSSIPENAIIDSAVLTLFSNHTPLNGQNGNANSGGDNSLFISRISEQWDYTSISWLNQPAVTTEGRISIPHTNAPFEDLSVDVKDMITALHSENNYGFMLHLQNETMYTFRIFCSSKYADESRHPRLEVRYHFGE